MCHWEEVGPAFLVFTDTISLHLGNLECTISLLHVICLAVTDSLNINLMRI